MIKQSLVYVFREHQLDVGGMDFQRGEHTINASNACRHADLDFCPS